MLKQVKVLTDEQTRQSLSRLREDFAEILAPLEKLDSIQAALEGLSERDSDLESSIGRKITDLSDSIAAVKGKVNEVLENQQDGLNKINVIYTEVTELKNILNAINWEE